MAVRQRLYPDDHMGLEPGMVCGADVPDPAVARGSFLLYPSHASLAAALSLGAQAAPQQRQPRAVLGAIDASGRAFVLFLGGGAALDRAVASRSRELQSRASGSCSGRWPYGLRAHRDWREP